MQSLIKKSKSTACEKTIPELRRHFGIASQQTTTPEATLPVYDTEKVSQRHIYKNDDGMIIFRDEDDVFYIRHDIIYAKAGDVFYMPRKVPDDFRIETAEMLSKEEFEKFLHLS